MTEQFEQAKRELAERWCLKVIECMKEDDYIIHAPDEFLSDLTALLEQHKEMITADMYPKEFIEWVGSEELYCDKGEWLLPLKDSVYGEIERKTSAELYNHWLKNVKK